MAAAFGTTPVGTVSWWRRWPQWAPRAACGWSLLYGCALAGVGATGGGLYGIPYLSWGAAAILLAGAVLAAATVRLEGTHRGTAAPERLEGMHRGTAAPERLEGMHRGTAAPENLDGTHRETAAPAHEARPRPRSQTAPAPGRPRRSGTARSGVIAAGLWGVAAVAAVSSVFVLLNLVELLTEGTVRDRAGHPDWEAFAERLCFVGVAVFFLLTALAWRHRTRGTCRRCGAAAHAPGEVTAIRRPTPPPSPRVRKIALVGGLAFAPYYACHMLRFLDAPPFHGGRLADPGDWFIPAFIVGTALPAEFLLQGLVRHWGMVFPRWTLRLAGRRVPRFLPIVPVWLIAPTLAAYGTGGWIYALLGMSGVVKNTFLPADYLLGCAAMTGFAGYGSALAVAAVSYQRRTRPVCVVEITRGPSRR